MTSRPGLPRNRREKRRKKILDNTGKMERKKMKGFNWAEGACEWELFMHSFN